VLPRLENDSISTFRKEDMKIEREKDSSKRGEKGEREREERREG
jgi:hypothetical protein